MVKDVETPLKEEELFSGGASTGISFAEFDLNVSAFLLEKYGMEIGHMLWEGDFVDFTDHDMLNPQQRLEWEDYCTLIYDYKLIK